MTVNATNIYISLAMQKAKRRESVHGLTVEGLQVDGESAGLAVASATFSTHIRPVTSVCSHMTRQLDGLGEDGLTILTHIHLP